jgi:hypothetical protein
VSRKRQGGPAGDRRANSDSIEWANYSRITPGEYLAHCYWGKRYRDPGFNRWTCLLRWDVLSEDAQRVIAQCVPLWFALGEGDKPKASRRGKYLAEWVRANGRPPTAGDRLSPNVFTKRFARVEVGDADSTVPYSVVRRIIRWETGSCRHSVSKSTSQGRPEISTCKREG